MPASLKDRQYIIDIMTVQDSWRLFRILSELWMALKC